MSQQLFYQGSYGAAPAKPAQRGLWVPPAGRARLNAVAILVSLVIPWGLFCVVSWVLSFSLHYQSPLFAYAIVFTGLLIVLTSGGYAAAEAKSKVAGTGKVPTWYVFFFATTLFAWIGGVVMGETNFFQNLQPFYDVTHLGAYERIDPSLFRGQQLMDAGRIVFTRNAKLDLRRAMGFRNQEMYCVAPISIAHQNGTFETLQTYDFWAVGVGCCSGSNPDFHCGEFNNPSARGGLRLMRDSDRAFYRLAVQQAEAAYNIKAAHPLFFTWMQDPIAEVNAYRDQGVQFFFVGVASYFVFQVFLVVVATVFFSKLGRT
jgi:hypothetical protein